MARVITPQKTDLGAVVEIPVQMAVILKVEPWGGGWIRAQRLEG